MKKEMQKAMAYFRSLYKGQKVNTMLSAKKFVERFPFLRDFQFVVVDRVENKLKVRFEK